VQRFWRQHAAGVVEWKAHIAPGALMPLLYVSPYEILHTVWARCTLALCHTYQVSLHPWERSTARHAYVLMVVTLWLHVCCSHTGHSVAAFHQVHLLHRFTIIAAAYPAHASVCSFWLKRHNIPVASFRSWPNRWVQFRFRIRKTDLVQQHWCAVLPPAVRRGLHKLDGRAVS
jgi:hypothetical protein